jgi:membrane-associated phospholipid phosphatase
MGRRGFGAALALAAVAGSYLAVRSGTAARVDAPARDVVGRAHEPGVDRVVVSATDLGSVYGLAGISASLTAAGHRREARDVAVSGLAAWTVAQSVKPLLVRERPYELGTASRLVARPAGSSWPSGHAAVTAAVAVAVAPRLGAGGRIAMAAASAAVGISRLHVGVHHLTDVIAGWGIGVLCGAVCSRRSHR